MKQSRTFLQSSGFHEVSEKKNHLKMNHKKLVGIEGLLSIPQFLKNVSITQTI